MLDLTDAAGNAPPKDKWLDEEDAVPKQGHWGMGRPLRTHSRYLRDGGGFCSPGRWPPSRRIRPALGFKVEKILNQETMKYGGVEAVNKLMIRANVWSLH